MQRLLGDVISIKVLFVCLLGLMLYVPVNSYGHVGMVSSPNHTFFLGKLQLAVIQYFVHTLWLVTQQPFLNQWERENDRRNYFKIKIHKIMGPGLDPTLDPWICVTGPGIKVWC